MRKPWLLLLFILAALTLGKCVHAYRHAQTLRKEVNPSTFRL